jgi:Protein of unknown function (DUF2510)
MTQPNMPPPDLTPGFYPDSQGAMRLWDGQRWTDITRPMPQAARPPPGQPGYYPDPQGVMRWWTGRDWAVNTQPPAATSPQPPNEPPKNWFQRNIGWKLAILLGVLVLGSCGAILGAGSDPEPAVQPTPASDIEITDSEAPEPEPTKTRKPTPKKQEPKTEPAAHVSKRQWAKIVKKPESYKGDKYIIYGQVTQFDSATGDDSFLADTAHRNTMSYDFFDGENTLLSGNAKHLDDLVEDDVFRASVTVLGKIDYDTQIGGNTTVPLLEVNSIKVIG